MAIDPAEQLRAERIVLGPKDFPAGWLDRSGLPAVKPTEVAGPTCAGFTPLLGAGTVRGAASYSSRWVKGPLILARAIVSVYSDAKQAKLVFDRAGAPYLKRCWAAGSLLDGLRVVSGAPLSLGSLGADQAVSLRARTTDITSGAELIIDFVYLRKGKAFGIVIFSSTPTPTKASLEAAIIRRLTSRMA